VLVCGPDMCCVRAGPRHGRKTGEVSFAMKMKQMVQRQAPVSVCI
jgi:hypothetical protein